MTNISEYLIGNLLESIVKIKTMEKQMTFISLIISL